MTIEGNGQPQCVVAFLKHFQPQRCGCLKASHNSLWQIVTATTCCGKQQFGPMTNFNRDKDKCLVVGGESGAMYRSPFQTLVKISPKLLFATAHCGIKKNQPQRVASDSKLTRTRCDKKSVPQRILAIRFAQWPFLAIEPNMFIKTFSRVIVMF